MKWSESGLVADTGFDSHSFRYWRKSPGAMDMKYVNNNFGQTELVIGPDGGEVSQVITGLEEGNTYAASVWISITNNQPATITVQPHVPTLNTPAVSKEAHKIVKVSKTIDRTVLTNYTDQSSKYMSKWHRIKVLFDVPAGVDSAEVVLTAGKGSADSAVYFDDVRVVKSGRSLSGKGAKDVVLFEDFENVDEGWGPFMYGWQGPMNTHLSETNLPFTDDTISGEFSLKTRNENHTGIIYRTVPATLELKANTRYRVSFEYLSDTSERYTFIAGSEDAGADSAVKLNLTEGTWKRTMAAMEFETGSQSDWFIGIHKNSKEKGILVIDNLLVEQ
jgi:hypothetical protein